MLRVIGVDELLPGMFVNNVIEQTGSLKIKSRGLVKTDKAISALIQQGVLKIEVDDSKSKLSEEKPAEAPTNNKKTKQQPINEQLSTANQLYSKAKEIQRSFIENIRNDGAADLDGLYDLSHCIIDSVFEAPNALSCLALIKKSDEYLLEHSLNCSVLMAMFARHMTLDTEVVEDLSMAALLMDVGMANIPEDILNQPGTLSEQEMEIVTTHVDIGLDIIERCGDVTDLIREVMFNHHERLDGSGYPDAKSDDDISIYANMAAIVDSYDAMTSKRPYQSAQTPTAALKALLGDPRYDQGLVQKFIQCMSVHPVGSLVKLTNDRLAIVIRANKKAPLQPTVATFYHLKSSHYAETKVVDLSKVSEDIEASVKPEEFGLNLNKFFRDVFISSLANAR